MKAVVLLSAGRHARSGAPMPVPAELKAIGLARGMGGEVTGLHAGARDSAVTDALGHGLGTITVLTIGADDDPLPALAAEIAALQPDLVLCGRRGQGGADTGLLPYRLARRAGMAIAADAIAVEATEAGLLAVVQSLPRGARRRLTLRLPAVVTVHPAAPAARAFVLRDRLAGHVMEKPGSGAPAPWCAVETRPYRKRPRLIGDGGTAGSAEERLLAATETQSAGGQLMVEPDPAEAARAIVTYLERFRAR